MPKYRQKNLSKLYCPNGEKLIYSPLSREAKLENTEETLENQGFLFCFYDISIQYCESETFGINLANA